MRHDRVVHSDYSVLRITAFLVLVMATSGSTGGAPDTRGREFLISAFSIEQAGSVTLEIIPQLPEVTHITITTPRTAPVLEQSFVTEAKKSLLITLPSSALSEKKGVGNNGVLVTTSADVSVIVMYQNHSDTCLCLPRDVLGTDYSLLLDEARPQGQYTVIIGAAYNNTTVNITGDPVLLFAVSGGVYIPDQQVLQLQLSAFQTFLLKSTASLTGLTVKSDQPVGVWASQVLPNTNKNGFLSEMVLPANTWGKKFVLVPPSNTANFTIRIMVRTNSSVKVQFGEGVTTHEVTTSTVLTLSFYDQPFVYIHSTSAALVLQTSVFSSPDGTDQSQMFYVPPVEQYLNNYTFSMNGLCRRICLRAVNPAQDTDGFLLDGQKLSSFAQFLSFFVEQRSYTIVTADSIDTGFHRLDHSIPTRSFCAYASYENEYGFRPLGMRMANLYEACTPSSVKDGGLGDGYDNDCDGSVDEELLNQIDDDNDGLIDEDTADFIVQVTSFDSQVVPADEVIEGVDKNIVAVIASLTVAIGAILVLIGSCLLHDFLKRRRGIRSTRIAPFVS